MFSKESNYIKRTSCPKYSSYTSDGCGRDKYILINNGGMLKNYSCSNLNEKTSGKYYTFSCLNRADSVKSAQKINWKASNLEYKNNNFVLEMKKTLD